MALTFGAASAHQVNIGSGASLDNLTTFSFAMWIKPASTANTGRGWMGKYNDATVGWEVNQLFADGTTFRLVTRRGGGGRLERRGATGVLTANVWAFVGGEWDEPAGLSNCYAGSLSSIVTLQNGALTNTGSVMTNDAALSCVIGNAVNGGTLSANSNIAYCQIWNRVIGIEEFRRQQFHPHKSLGSVGFYLLGYAGTGTQPDWSGNGNNGTVTGATVAAHVPLGPIFGRKSNQISAIGWDSLLSDYRNRMMRAS